MLNESLVVLSTCTDWLVVVTISTGCLLSKRACLLRLNGSMFSVNVPCSRVSKCVDRVSRLVSVHLFIGGPQGPVRARCRFGLAGVAGSLKRPTCWPFGSTSYHTYSSTVTYYVLYLIAFLC